MGEETRGRREGATIQAVDPVSGKRCEVMVSQERMKAVATRSMGQTKECAYLVPYILQTPSSVFEGLRREEDEDPRGVGWRCYCGLPTAAYRANGTEVNPYPGQVYLVFVNQAMIAYNWRWERADPDNPRLPNGHEIRFRTRLL